MRYFIFDYYNDDYLIESFLDSLSLAHKHEKKTKEWFLWKFKDNPYGESILACAEEKGVFIGCVGIGIQIFIKNEKEIKGGLSFETFTHPSYQNKGIFKNLIKNAENESLRRGLKFILNFPNKNSLPGFLSIQWKKEDIAEYWIKSSNFFILAQNFKELKNGFIPNNSNVDQLVHNKNFDFFQKNEDHFYSKINYDYLIWRFFTNPISEYAVINDENCFSIGRVGYRGKLKEVQILFINSKEDLKINFRELLKNYKIKTNYDLISVPVSSENSIRKYLFRNLFFKVPNNVNVCYKILDSSFCADFSKLSINAINYHTY